MTWKTVILAYALLIGIHEVNADSSIYSSGYPVSPPSIMPEGDRLLLQRIQDKIRNDPSLSDNAKHINITVRDGNVTLQGLVDSDDERNRIGDMVRTTNGVRQMDNRLYLPVIF